MIPENWCSWQSRPTQCVENGALPAHPHGLCHNASLQPLSGTEKPQSSSAVQGLGLLLYLQVTEQMNSFPGKTGWGRV